MPQAQINLTEEQMSALEELARQRKIMLADLLQESVDYLLRSMTTASKVNKKQRALAVAGRFHSGLGDLSRQHDKYLTEE
jgi:hypothetical protein